MYTYIYIYIYIYIYTSFKCNFEIWVFPSVFIEFTNGKSDSTDEVPGYIHSSPVIKLYKFL